MHILEEWRLRDIEQKAERANSRLHEIDSLRSDVGNLERALREACAEINGLRAELQTMRVEIEALKMLTGEHP